MEVSERFAGCASNVYQTLLDLFKQDYQESTGKKIVDSKIRNGLHYQKKFGKRNENSVRVTVGEMISNHQYSVAISSNRGVQWLTYLCEDTGINEVRITYLEEYLPEGKLNGWNYKFMLPFMKKNLEKRMRLQIRKLAEFAQNKEVQ